MPLPLKGMLKSLQQITTNISRLTTFHAVAFPVAILCNFHSVAFPVAILYNFITHNQKMYSELILYDSYSCSCSIEVSYNVTKLCICLYNSTIVTLVAKFAAKCHLVKKMWLKWLKDEKIDIGHYKPHQKWPIVIWWSRRLFYT